MFLWDIEPRFQPNCASIRDNLRPFAIATDGTAMIVPRGKSRNISCVLSTHLMIRKMSRETHEKLSGIRRNEPKLGRKTNAHYAIQ